MSKLRIVAVGEVVAAKDGRSYFPVTFRAGIGQKGRTINFWEIFKRDKAGNPTLEKIWERGTPSELKAAMASGELIDGEIVTRNVEGYQLTENGQMLNTYTTIVFPDQKEEAVFAAANHNIVNEHGEVLGKKKAVLATSANQATQAEPALTEKAPAETVVA